MHITEAEKQTTELLQRREREVAAIKQEENKNINFISVKEALPETNGNVAFVYMKRSGGKIMGGMFYMNGRKPVFAAYGSQINDVIAWAYR